MVKIIINYNELQGLDDKLFIITVIFDELYNLY